MIFQGSDVTPPGPTTAPPPEECTPESWIGDSACDDHLNNEVCGWDGGDCCGDDVITQWCTVSSAGDKSILLVQTLF